MRWQPWCLFLCGALVPQGLSAAPKAVSPVSPGSTEGMALIAESCPTFLWAGMEEAEAYELVVYRVADRQAGEEELEAVLRVSVPGSATGWTPSLERCLERGGRYAWSLRMVGEEGEAAEWSEANLFEVSAGPSLAEVEEALRVLRRWRRRRHETGPQLQTSAAGEPRAREDRLRRRRARRPAMAREEAGSRRSSGPGAAATKEDERRNAERRASDRFGREIRDWTDLEDRELAGLRSTTAATAAPTQGTASLTVDQQVHLGAASDVFKDGSLFLWSDSDRNTALGTGALSSNTLGTDSTAVGFGALQANTGDPTGSYNTAVGSRALYSNTTGYRNTAIGGNTLSSITTGVFHTAVGFEALSKFEGGFFGAIANTAIGARALYNNTSGIRNTAVGFRALYNNLHGDYNTAVGVGALVSNTGSRNIGIGNGAGGAATAGNRNIFIGHIGDPGDEGVIRIGNEFQHTKASIAGDLGLGTESPGNRLHVQDSIADVADPENHVALIRNTSGDDGPDVLALKVGEVGQANIGSGTNFITFFDGADASLGAIQGTGAGVTLAGPGNDYAEWLLKLDPEEALEPGDVVGLYGGKISRSTRGAQRVMVLSTGPIVSGNDPGEELRHLYARVAFVGQVEVRVRGPVSAGDLVLASGREDGTAVAVAPERLEIGQVPSILGRALEASSGEGLKSVRVMVGLADPEPLYRLLQPRPSTRRHKEAIRGMGEASSGLLALRPVTFRYKEEVVSGPRPTEYGLLAEEVAELYSDLVTYDDEGQPFSVRYHVLIPMLLNELQRQERLLAEQRRDFERLETQLEKLARSKGRGQALPW